MCRKQVYLGIAGVYSHDSAAALVIDGKIVAVAEEERFTREKHTGTFPYNSIEFCLRQAAINPPDVDCIAYYINPQSRILPALKFNFSTAYSKVQYTLSRKGAKCVVESLKSAWDVERAILQGYMATKEYSHKFPKAQFVCVDHHDAHAASAFFTSPFHESSVLTVDLIGEWDTTRFYRGQSNSLEFMGSACFPESLGKLYQTFTKFLGFAPNSDEYKVMGLAAYGTDRFVPFFEQLYTLIPEGFFTLNRDMLLFCKGIRPEWDGQITDKLGQPKKKGDQINQNHRDIAYALQHSAQQILIHLTRSVIGRTGDRKLCMAGGVALNALANQQIRESGLVDQLFVQPASYDAGTALGAALFCYFKDNRLAKRYPMETCYLGPEYSRKEIEQAISDTHFKRTEGIQTVRQVVDYLTEGKIVSLFQGRMEFGPRALGNRSILADPRDVRMKDTVNTKVKFREAFRPFAPVVLEEKVNDYFVNGLPSPFMTQTFTATDRSRKNIPATVHQDGTARIQTVTHKSNPLLYEIIKLFEQKTGISVLMNTSFNVAGEPIVCTPADAVKTFIHSGIDALLMEDILLVK